MPNVHSTLTSLFSDIADAIRAKTGSGAALTADAFPQAIAAIPQGGGGSKPAYLISDGDVVSDFYFNTEYDLDGFLASLSYTTDPGTGLDVCELGLGYFYAVDLANAGLSGEYALVWNDGVNIVPIFTTCAVPPYGVASAGWQVTSYSPAAAVTVDTSSVLAAFAAIMDNVVAKDDIAFGEHGGGKAHTFEIPTISGTYTYNGSVKTPAVNGFYGDFMTKSGNVSATNAGDYSLTVSLKDAANCQWNDGTTGAKTLSWSIAKAVPPKPSLSSTSVLFDDTTLSSSFTVSRNGDGAVIAVSSDPSIVSAAVSGTTVTVTQLDTSAASTVTITVTVAEGTNYLAYSLTDATASVIYRPETLTSITIKLTNDNTTVPINYSQNTSQGVYVNWGDGTSSAPQTGGSASSYATCRVSHTYSSAGTYKISFVVTSGLMSLAGTYQQHGITANLNVFQIPNSSVFRPDGLTVESIEFSESKIAFLMANAFSRTYSKGPLVIPANITDIGGSAFRYCSFSSITVLSTTPPTIASSTFDDTSSTIPIYVPAESVETYKTASGWSLRSEYIQAIPS